MTSCIRNRRRVSAPWWAWLLWLVACFGQVVPAASRPDEVLVGVNVDNPQWLDPAQRDGVVAELHAAGVKVVRFPLAPPYEASIGFLRAAAEKDIRAILVVTGWDGRVYPPGTPIRRSAGIPAMYDMPPLSRARPDLFRTWLSPLFGQIETLGIELAGIEVGNEINWAAFNGDFSLPVEGRVLTDKDLEDDLAGRRIAEGFRSYLDLLRVVKDVRDASRVNAQTPIVSAGLADWGVGGSLPGFPAEAVAIGATLRYLKANGLDDLVDAYGVHTYPDPHAPKDRRDAQFRDDTFSECRHDQSRKPCWLTEWGIPFTSTACPLQDDEHVSRVGATLDSFEPFIKSGSLRALVYYEWQNDADPLGIFRCGRLTESGRRILATPRSR